MRGNNNYVEMKGFLSDFSEESPSSDENERMIVKELSDDVEVKGIKEDVARNAAMYAKEARELLRPSNLRELANEGKRKARRWSRRHPGTIGFAGGATGAGLINSQKTKNKSISTYLNSGFCEE